MERIFLQLDTSVKCNIKIKQMVIFKALQLKTSYEILDTTTTFQCN